MTDKTNQKNDENGYHEGLRIYIKLQWNRASFFCSNIDEFVYGFIYRRL